MYTQHFNLTGEPFSLTPDPEFLYLSAGHAEALAALKVGLLGRRGLMVMTGEVGTGKTTLLYALLRALGDVMRTAYVANTGLGFDGLLRLALADFAVQPGGPARVDMLTALNQFLRDCAERGVTATLIVDEAQNLDAEAFEQLRLLSNFETFTHKLLQIVLVGQPELEIRLRQPALRALAERVAVHCRLAPLSARESRSYVDYRLLRVGGSARLFERGARDLLLGAAAGLPRRINILCHNALLFAYGRGLAAVTLPVAQLAVAGRTALQSGTQPERVDPVVVPSARRTPPFALAFGGAALAAALAFAGLHVPAWLAGMGHTESPGTTLDTSAAAALALTEDAGTTLDESASARIDDADVPDVPPPAAVAAVQPVRVAELPVSASPEPSAPADDAAPPVKAAADPRFRTVRVERGSTLESLVRGIYGGVDAALIKRIQVANPQVVDPNLIVAGDLLRFPEIEPVQPAAQKGDLNE